MKTMLNCRSSARTVISVVAVLAIAGCASLLSAGQATAATSLIAAYDKYVSGKGFEIGLVDTGTGANIALPAGVNTADDELHPALTPDGRFLIFTRMQVRPLLNGNVIPPSGRTLVMVNRATGQMLAPISGDIAGAGPTIAGAADRFRLAYGLRPAPPVPGSGNRRVVVAGLPAKSNGVFSALPGDDLTIGFGALEGESATSVLDVPGATVLQRSGGRTHAYAQLQFDPATGTVTKQNLVLEARAGTGSTVTNRFVYRGFQQPTLRAPDGLAAFSDTSIPGSFGVFRIKTQLVPGQTAVEVAPGGINSGIEVAMTMPAWSPDGSRLAFVRRKTTGTHARALFVFDSTPGIQTVINPGIDLGVAPPTAQLRTFHDLWGGISVALETQPNAVAITCSIQTCIGPLSGAALGSANLTPTASGGAVSSNNVGILVAKVVGKQTLFGRKVLKIKSLGRVPLGRAKSGRNRFKWNGKVAGHKLTRGKYVITYRVLARNKRVRAISRSISFSVSAVGRVSSPRLVK